MKYVVCEKPGMFALKEKDTPTRKPSEALLKIKKIGVCGTDLHAYAGNQAYFTYPRILGHELCAEVLEIGNNPKNIKAGDLVVVIPYLNCGKCIACINGKTNCCTNMQVIGVHVDGGMQEQICVPVDKLIPANHLTEHQIAIAEPLAIAAHALRRAQLKSGETIAVMGCGPIGVGLAKQAQILGAKVIAIDTNADRLKYAKEAMGCDFTVNALDEPLQQITDITQGNLCTAVFDATGNKMALETGPQYMSHGGRYVLVGLSNGDLVYNHPQIHAKETSILCSRNATLEDFERVMDILPEFPTEDFITHQVPFDKMIEDFDSWIKPETGVMKAIIDLN